ncbi:shikimate-5-dehydrogenase [Cylindrobasidium torrendii FP15055 ss-10]|uniref:shikimate kinase n=1 Tax=Cylindrobasidium torrendii FP15055 ss-10 TaxID=1314674 RepID=A0A0D7AWR8_9AGAR|nr:shikimate-5-dehydrogenase [Cylindrobasidium torrendii FP15055 ss-10]
MLSVASSGASSPMPSTVPPPTYSRRASIVLIGMRGVGKTTLGTIAAKALGWELLDTDRILENQEKMSISDYIATHGWEAFRALESQIIHDILRVHHTGKVIACGGGVVELEENRAMLAKFRQHGPVIHVLREKEFVLEFLRKPNNRFPPFLHETAREAWTRREKYFRECCSFEFVSMTVDVPPEEEGNNSLALKPVEEEFFRLLRFIHGVDCNKVHLTRGGRTYFLALTYDDIRNAIADIEELSHGIDLWEVRADLLLSQDPTFIAYQIATLRRHSTLPILFTLRSVSYGGKYPDSGNHKADILCHALTLGVEYIDLEMSLPDSTLHYILDRKGNASTIVTHQDVKGVIVWSSPQTRQLYDRMVRRGADVVKIASLARSFEDNMSLRQFVGSVERNSVPFIAINMGPEGKISRVLNPVLSPLSHPLLPRAAAPGQISFTEAQSILYLTGLLQPMKFYLFGNPISHSMSPMIHNTAFKTLGLPHTYELKETDTTEELRELMQAATFGGASVTIPFKVDIMPYLQHISRHARIIGAINTIIRTAPGVLTGENTDWRAIKICLQRSLAPSNVVTSKTTALVLGAGGTSRAALYALHQIGVVNIFIYNRTRRRAQALADEFSKLDPLLSLTVLDQLEVPLQISPLPTMIVSTIPATSTAKLADGSLIDIGLREEHFSDLGGVAIELAYERRITKLLALAQDKRDKGAPWAVVEGIELLLEQGYEQFRLWTSRRAPKVKVREKVLEAYAEQKQVQMKHRQLEASRSTTPVQSPAP